MSGGESVSVCGLRGGWGLSGEEVKGEESVSDGRLRRLKLVVSWKGEWEGEIGGEGGCLVGK